MSNTLSLSSSLTYLRGVVVARLKVFIGQQDRILLDGVAYFKDDSSYAQFISKYQPTFEEYILLLLTLTPHIQPNFYNQIIAECLPEGGDFPEFGGVRGNNHRGILPTGETAQFVIAGNDLEKRLKVQLILSSDHWFSKKHILWLEHVPDGEPLMSGRLVLDPEIVEQLTILIVHLNSCVQQSKGLFIMVALSCDDSREL